MQKGQATILILVGILIILAVAGGAYYLGRQTTPKSSSASVVNSQPSSENPSPTVVKLSDAWNLGTKTYANPKIDITFQYPKYFIVTEVDIDRKNADFLIKYKDDPNVKQPLYSSTFSAVFDTHKPRDPVSQEICDNKMTVSIQKYDNTKELPLYDFISDINKSYPGDGMTETFDTYKKSLKSTNLPKEDSYVFKGIIGENPVKTVYFVNKGKVYTFNLFGNCDTGGQYTPDADAVFENMLKSITYL